MDTGKDSRLRIKICITVSTHQWAMHAHLRSDHNLASSRFSHFSARTHTRRALRCSDAKKFSYYQPMTNQPLINWPIKWRNIDIPCGHSLTLQSKFILVAFSNCMLRVKDTNKMRVWFALRNVVITFEIVTL